MQAVFLIFLFVLGACLGSFLCCQARRLHLREKERGNRAHPKAKRTKLPSRSVCLHCKKPLKWYDNLPIISWLALRGHCRYCHQKIGLAEFLSELGTGAAFLALGTTVNLDTASPLDWPILLTTLLLTLPLIFCAIYDGLYGELPTAFLFLALALALLLLAFKTASTIITTGFAPELIWQPVLAVLILAGTYLALYLVSKGKWVGDGDWLLALALAVALGQAWLALLTLFLANFLACLFSLKSFQNPKKAPKIHLGPFLITAFVIVLTFANFFQSML
ncbi:prepilin peptidase [Candidatus Saccharibacteria bacterium]|nr:prepilin peptidase [Candidatus Saccharibacteria bacterium]